MTRLPLSVTASLVLMASAGLTANAHAASFADIEAEGLSNACYADSNHHEAEFLFQNPDVCFWSAQNGEVNAVATPTPPDDAVALPRPSGRNDTAALEAVINANRGGSVVGSGTYQVRDLDITVPVDIYSMAMVPVAGAGRMVNVDSPDVRIFNSPIDARNQSSVYQGFHALDGSDRFTLVNSGVSNLYHRGSRYNAAGVYLNGVSDFHLACNDFSNILNRTSRSGTTSRANAIWMNGRNAASTSGGVIVNNSATELQSNGQLGDAEFLTIQSYRRTDVDRPTRIFANRAVDAGKRFTKHQEDNALVLSNSYEWTVKQGPLGQRRLLSHVEVHSSNNIIARNNRVKIAAQSKFDHLFFTKIKGSGRQDNLHYDCNDIEIVDRLRAGDRATPRIITARASSRSRNSTGFEATNSSARDNVVRGSGSIKHYYSFEAGYARQGGTFDISNNRFDVPFTHSEFRR